MFSLEARSRKQEARITAAREKQLAGVANFWLLASHVPPLFWRDIKGAALGWFLSRNSVFCDEEKMPALKTKDLCARQGILSLKPAVSRQKLIKKLQLQNPR